MTQNREELYLGCMIFARLMIRSFVNLEARLEAAGRPSSYQAERLKYHQRYTRYRKALEKFQRAKKG